MILYSEKVVCSLTVEDFVFEEEQTGGSGENTCSAEHLRRLTLSQQSGESHDLLTRFIVTQRIQGDDGSSGRRGLLWTTGIRCVRSVRMLGKLYVIGPKTTEGLSRVLFYDNTLVIQMVTKEIGL